MIIHIKELINHKTTTELFEYFKEQLIDLYNQLSICENIESNLFIEFLQRSNVYLFVNESMKIIGAITALYERKMIHNGGIVCHIEDFVVHTDYRNQGIGKRLMNHVLEDAKEKKCYKIILDCGENMYNYYQQYGFETKNIQMSYYIE
jgi:ribosomal protein S18 acetylase RimI-like enzyme